MAEKNSGAFGSRRQQLALLFLAHSWGEQCWTSINAVLRMHGERSPNGAVTAKALVRRGLATQVREYPMTFRATDKGRVTAMLLKIVTIMTPPVATVAFRWIRCFLL